MTIDPFDLVATKLEGVKHRGEGKATARCPAHPDRNASLSFSRGRNGGVLIRCWAGCDLHSIVSAMGLQVSDLFPTRPQDNSPAGKAARREAWQMAGWAAALRVLAREASVVLIAARMVADSGPLSGEDAERLSVAVGRIESAREVLA